MNVSSSLNKLHEDKLFNSFPNFDASSAARLVQSLLLTSCSVRWGERLDSSIKKILPVG